MGKNREEIRKRVFWWGDEISDFGQNIYRCLRESGSCYLYNSRVFITRNTCLKIGESLVEEGCFKAQG